MSRNIATNDRVDIDGLLEFIGSRHRHILVTARRDGRPQLSPVAAGVKDRRILISTYPQRAKVADLRRTPLASVLVLSGKCLIRISIERWGPVATGGFPPQLAQEPT